MAEDDLSIPLIPTQPSPTVKGPDRVSERETSQKRRLPAVRRRREAEEEEEEEEEERRRRETPDDGLPHIDDYA